MKRDFGLDILLNMDGFESHYPNRYWYKIKARLVEPTEERPHGIRYPLTFHDNHGTRIFGIDNKHVPKNKRNNKGTEGLKIDQFSTATLDPAV